MGVMNHNSGLATDVVVVDDDLDSSEALADLLHDRGYSVTSAANGREALDYLRRCARPGIILLDMMMPVMDGYEFLEQQSRETALLDIPVVVMTGTPQLRLLWAKAILLKPVQPKELFKIIEQFLPAKP
jgi:CheY-like chemotaxis protein